MKKPALSTGPSSLLCNTQNAAFLNIVVHAFAAVCVAVVVVANAVLVDTDAFAIVSPSS